MGSRGKRLGIDVDGVVLDLMGAYRRHLWSAQRYVLDTSKITKPRLAECPLLDHSKIDHKEALRRFLISSFCYDDVEPIPGAVEAIERLQEICAVVFITAIMVGGEESYASKARNLNARFPSIPIISCPAHQKSWFNLRWAIDDRYDTCLQYEEDGVEAFLFKQPWNDAPEGTPAYDWSEIVKMLEDDADRWPK